MGIYRSGLEALCTSLADAVVEDTHVIDDSMPRHTAKKTPRTEAEKLEARLEAQAWAEYREECAEVKKKLVRALFNDAGRFESDSAMSRTWSLSPSGRINMFEDAWVGREDRRNWAGAVGACVKALCDMDSDDDVSGFWAGALMRFGNLQALMEERVLPAMRQGMRTERYYDFEAQAFAQGISDLFAKADSMGRVVVPARAGADARSAQFRPLVEVLVERLVAAVIYGPTCELAVAHDKPETDDWESIIDPDLVKSQELANPQTLIVAQVFDDIHAKVGAINSYDASSVVFVGRSKETDDYLAKARACGYGDLVRDRTPQRFQIAPLHTYVSNCHAMMVQEGGAWYVYDLNSKNGTQLVGPGVAVEASPMVKLVAGDTVVLGTAAGKADAYIGGASLHVFMPVRHDVLARLADQ